MDFVKLQDREKELLLAIMKHTQITRKQLASLLHMTNATLCRTVDSFRSEGILITRKDEKNVVIGRPSDLVQFNKEYGYFFSICIRRFAYRTALIDFGFHIIDTQTFSCDANSSAIEIRETCWNSLQHMMRTHNVQESKIIGITLASFSSRKMVSPHPGFSWVGVPDIRNFFQERFGCTVFWGHAAIAASCAKYYGTYFPDYKNLAYIILDEGIGIGYIIDKKIARTSMRNVNALGHMIVDINGPKCYCGQYGCLEAIVNDFAITKRAQNALKLKQTGLLFPKIDSLTIEDITEAAEKGDSIACQELEYSASVLSVGIENFLRIFRLEVIIISGKLVKGSSFFFSTLKKRLLLHHPNLVVKTDDAEWENTLKGSAIWYMNELLSLTPLPELL